VPSSQTLDLLAEELFNNFADLTIDMTSVAKILELIGTSDEGWEDAAQAAVKEALKTIHGISGVEVVDMTAKVDMKTGKIVQYRTTVKIAVGVDQERE
jgi:flavin-binding protein dodecin